MLTCLRVRNFAIIDALEVEFGTGLNVVTGETGAGKSILIDALDLVLGGRARPEVVRTGAKEAEVEALFDLTHAPAVRARLAAAGIDAEDEVVVRRTVSAAGKSRAYVGGRLVTLTELAALSQGLADISSQHEHHSLVDTAAHLDYLDAFAGHPKLTAEARDVYASLAEADRALSDLETRVRERGEREDLLRHQLAEIEQVAPTLGEDTSLEEERERLRHAESLARAAGGAADALYERDDALLTTLAHISKDVEEAAQVDARLAPMAEALESARTALEETARDLGRYAQHVTVDPARLSEVEDRLDAITRLKRKYGGSIDRVLQHAETTRSALGDLDEHETRLHELRSRRDAAWDQARKTAKALSDSRHRAAKRLGKAIGDELETLGMGGASVVVQVEALEGKPGEFEVGGAKLTPRGMDRAEFLISPNPGEDAKPLRKVASGGELSRALLAIKRVLAGLRPAGMYVFDEVDTGVGGAVAEVIGRKLRDVARHHQVLCITHLPQIAVFADAHFLVEKTVVGGRTKSVVRPLEGGEREGEIARMLGGIKVTKKTREAAIEMIRQAAEHAQEGA